MTPRGRYVMPEGPEIRTSSLFVNHVCRSITFTGNPQKSTVSKNPDVITQSPPSQEERKLLCFSCVVMILNTRQGYYSGLE